MRNLRNPQLELGEVHIEDIKLNHKSRDDIPTLLIGLQYLYSQEALRDRLFALMEEFILPGINRKVGRPGMEMWSILVILNSTVGAERNSRKLLIVARHCLWICATSKEGKTMTV